MEKNNEVLEKLKKITLFAEIKENEDYLSKLINICRIKNFSKGDVIIKEGEIGGEMYIIFKGAIEIRKRTRAGDDYTVFKSDAEQNFFFGELALIDDDKRSATVIASEDSSFLVISKKAFIKLGNENPGIGLPVTRAIAQKLSAALRKTTDDMLTIFDALVEEMRS
jgi:CRP/FNR family transcriptional regulator, cyclic AMP receptor protein